MSRGKPVGRRWSVWLVATLLVVAGCSSDDDVIDVFAAASLTNAFAELEEAFEERNDGIDVRLNLGGSSTLREQIRDGAPADVFASANRRVMQSLVDDGLLPSTPILMATNELVLAVPAGNPGQVVGLQDLADDDLLVGVCSPGVPCGDLAQDWFASAGISPSLDTAEGDVRALTLRLAEAELDVALVYATDVAAAAIEIDRIPADPSGPSTAYPIASLTTDGQAFVEFVLSADGQAILAGWGFGAP